MNRKCWLRTVWKRIRSRKKMRHTFLYLSRLPIWRQLIQSIEHTSNALNGECVCIWFCLDFGFSFRAFHFIWPLNILTISLMIWVFFFGFYVFAFGKPLFVTSKRMQRCVFAIVDFLGVSCEHFQKVTHRSSQCNHKWVSDQTE